MARPEGDDFDGRVGAELAKLRGQWFTLHVNGLHLWMVLANLQLAVRHPANSGPSAAVATQFAREVQAMIAPEGLLKAVAEMGWDPAHDRPANG